MKALAEQISELDSIVIYGRVVGVRGLVMERAMPSGRYPAVNVPQPVSRTMPACGRSGLSPSAHASAPGHGDLCGHGGAFGSEPIVPGPAPEVDEAIRLHKPLEAFLAQGKEEATSLAEGYRRLAEIVAASETER
jgi:flagellum-specific ATP synthase